MFLWLAPERLSVLRQLHKQCISFSFFAMVFPIVNTDNFTFLVLKFSNYLYLNPIILFFLNQCFAVSLFQSFGGFCIFFVCAFGAVLVSMKRYEDMI